MTIPCKIVGVINSELLKAVSSVPAFEHKGPVIKNVLDQLFLNHDWTQSFAELQFIVYEEVLTSEILIEIHRWLRGKCLDIENIRLVTIGHLGVAEWWKKWAYVNHEKSFEIKELFVVKSQRVQQKFLDDIFPLPDIEFYKKQKSINRLFSFYGGTYTALQREYLILKMLEFADHACIDFLSRFGDKQDLLAYVENITYYKSQNEVNRISDAYDRYLENGYLIKKFSEKLSAKAHKDEKLKFNGFQWEIDRTCWASVVRETANDDNFSCVSEKTIRAFIHHNVIIPIGFSAVTELEKLGFWFPHDMIDYSYQTEKIFFNRVEKLVGTLKQLSTYSYDYLQSYYLDNISKFHHNAELVQKHYSQYCNFEESWKKFNQGII